MTLNLSFSLETFLSFADLSDTEKLWGVWSTGCLLNGLLGGNKTSRVDKENKRQKQWTETQSPGPFYRDYWTWSGHSELSWVGLRGFGFYSPASASPWLWASKCAHHFGSRALFSLSTLRRDWQLASSDSFWRARRTVHGKAIWMWHSWTLLHSKLPIFIFKVSLEDSSECPLPSFKTRFLWSSLSRLGWPRTQRSTCFCLLSAGIKGFVPQLPSMDFSS